MRERFGEYCICIILFDSDVFWMFQKLGDSWWKRWLNVRANISNRAKEVLENMQNYFHSREQNSLQSLRTRRIPAIDDENSR